MSNCRHHSVNFRQRVTRSVEAGDEDSSLQAPLRLAAPVFASSDGEQMERKILSLIGCLMLCASVVPQGAAAGIEGGGHLLGETAGSSSPKELLWICYERAREKTGECEPAVKECEQCV